MEYPYIYFNNFFYIISLSILLKLEQFIFFFIMIFISIIIYNILFCFKLKGFFYEK